MKQIIQKGIAGFGNRFSVLGYCYDLALRNDCKLLVDWRDSSWRDNFSWYFELKTDRIADFQEEEYNDVRPAWWKDRINGRCAKKLAGEYFARAEQADIKSGCETLVLCQYLADYTDSIFEAIDFSKRIKVQFELYEMIIGGEYECWHIRNTDKKGEDAKQVMKQIIEHKTTLQKVLITDCFDCKREAWNNDIHCFSFAPPSINGKGIHHFSDKEIVKRMNSKINVNENVLCDIMLGVNAVKFHETCHNSSYSKLIKRMIKFKGKD